MAGARTVVDPAAFLSGGGAPGFGHIGGVRALREAGVPIDLIGGVSQGGLTAWQAAANVPSR